MNTQIHNDLFYMEEQGVKKTCTSQNTSLTVNDLALDEKELNRLAKKGKTEQRAPKASYTVVMQDGCDFAIARRDAGKRTATRLVVLPSQSQYYIEEGKERLLLTRKRFRSFVSGLGEKDAIMLPNVSWISRLWNNRYFCRQFMDIIEDSFPYAPYDLYTRGCRNEMIRHGILYFDLHALHRNELLLTGDLGEDRTMDRRTGILCGSLLTGDFGERRITDRKAGISCEFSLEESMEEIQSRFGYSQLGDGVYGHYPVEQPAAGLAAGPFEDPFDHLAERTVFVGEMNINDPKDAVRMYGGYDPKTIEKCGDPLGLHDSGFGFEYDQIQLYMYSVSAPLYRYMLKMMAGRRGVTFKELLQDIISDVRTRESMLFQSFTSFVMISYAFGMETARSAMVSYLDSGIMDIIPARWMAGLLFGKISAFDSYAHPGRNSVLLLRDNKPVYGFGRKSFLKYLFSSSVEQGYSKNMNLFLYQWGQVLFLQKALEMRKVEKYPDHLASRAIELMSLVSDYRRRTENKLWKAAARYAEPLEYEGEKYRIIAPRSLKELIHEADQQGNCLRTYEQGILSRNTRVVFLRSTDEAEKDDSLVTIEVDGNDRVIQCKGRFNENPPAKIWEFILEWEKARSLKDATGCIPARLLQQAPIALPVDLEAFDVPF